MGPGGQTGQTRSQPAPPGAPVGRACEQVREPSRPPRRRADLRVGRGGRRAQATRGVQASGGGEGSRTAGRPALWDGSAPVGTGV